MFNHSVTKIIHILADGETLGRTHAGRVVPGQERAYYLKDHLGSV
jgi:hypothetical protein